MIYFPITANILTVGHIKALQILSEKDFVTVGVLTSNALKGYKEEIVPFEERRYIMEIVANGIDKDSIDVVEQDSLDPTENIKKYNCKAIASGDGWEETELQVISKLGIIKVDFDSGHKRHSSDIFSSPI